MKIGPGLKTYFKNPKDSYLLCCVVLISFYVKAKVLELAGTVVIDNDAIEQDVPFMEAGLDSLGSVQFVTDVSTAFGIQLPPSAIFDYPTGRALIDHIIEETT